MQSQQTVYLILSTKSPSHYTATKIITEIHKPLAVLIAFSNEVKFWKEKTLKDLIPWIKKSLVNN